MRDLLHKLISETQEELTRLAYEKEEQKEVIARNKRTEKAYRMAIESGLKVEHPILEIVEDLEKDIKMGKAILRRLETVAEMFEV